MPRRVANVWGAACPKCHVPKDAGCRDLRSSTGLLFGRRTHKERARKVKELGMPYVNYPSLTLTTSTGTFATSITNAINTTATTLDSWVRPMYASTTSAASLTVNNVVDNLHFDVDPTKVWQGWVNTGRTELTFEAPAYYYQQPVWEYWVEDEEQRAAMLAEQRRQADELQARREQQARERLAAEQRQMENQLVAHARALDLLDDLLTEEERALRVQEQRVTVLGSDGRLYAIEMHRETVHGNIVRIDEHGCVLGRACVAPRMYDGYDALPTPDGWVGQYLGLKFDAEQFLSHANWSSLRGCQFQSVAA